MVGDVVAGGRTFRFRLVYARRVSGVFGWLAEVEDPTTGRVERGEVWSFRAGLELVQSLADGMSK